MPKPDAPRPARKMRGYRFPQEFIDRLDAVSKRLRGLPATTVLMEGLAALERELDREENKSRKAKKVS